MRIARIASVVAAAALATALAPGVGLAGEATVTTTVVSRVSGAEAFIEHVRRVEVGSDGAVFVMDVEGAEHEVEVDLGGITDDVKGRLLDDKTDLVDLAVVPVAVGAVLRFLGYLLRLGQL